ncbi:2,' 3'-cyclic nucleotide 2'-phosphodiesterase [Salibacterium salarium]|uniref:2,' 3'-cyclic nucleotide 2'-phosphodiesterase n=1 Tax=Salibacterium salarium TaxID=284579 RepID=A0A428N953_9BACI|nr:5'-nucleotidase C-terminal domain-containing protein [Salibacterium salarium]RSL34898.1 2,' 3'-cyclic nucleotide 2'-phosphodiesterase [Salibacterium salarium]
MKNYYKKMLSLGTVLTLGLLIVPSQPDFAKADSHDKEIQLLTLNDWHGQIATETSIDVGDETMTVGGAEYLAAHLQDYKSKNENTIVAHSGDMIGGSPMIASAFQDQPVVEIMEAMNVDVGTVGNHEFDEGIEEFNRMIEGGAHPDVEETKDYDGIDFPNIAANVYDSSTDELLLDPYYIKEIDDVEIGFIGVATTETPGMVKKQGNENLDVRDELEAINTYSKELVEDQGVDAIVVLAHNPAAQEDATFTNEKLDDKTIAKADGGTLIEDVANWENELHDEVDVIVAGHNHQTVNATLNDDVAVVQAWEYGYAFGAINLVIDSESGDIIGEETEAEIIYNTQDITPDAKVSEIINKYNDLIEPIQNEVVGESAYNYDNEGYPYNDRAYADHAIGNLIADSMAWSMDSDIGIMNGGGIREGLDAGEITFGDLYAIQPFQNMLETFTVDGAGLREIMNNQISSYGLDYSISGFEYTYTFDHDKEQGQVEDMFLSDGTPIEDDSSYTVTTNDYSYLADGMDEYALGKTTIGGIDSDILRDYVEEMDEPLAMKPEGRIRQVTNQFEDIPLDSWANPYVFDLAHNAVVDGTSETTFSPYQNVTRAQFTYMMTNALDLSSSSDAPFEDIGELADVSQEEIMAAYNAGIVQGTSDETFEPNKPITRAQMVTMLMRAYEYENGEKFEASSSTFEDIHSINQEMRIAAESAHELGYIDGYGNQFMPNNTATRAQAAKVLSLYMLK